MTQNGGQLLMVVQAALKAMLQLIYIFGLYREADRQLEQLVTETEERAAVEHIERFVKQRQLRAQQVLEAIGQSAFERLNDIMQLDVGPDSKEQLPPSLLQLFTNGSGYKKYPKRKGKIK